MSPSPSSRDINNKINNTSLTTVVKSDIKEAAIANENYNTILGSESTARMEQEDNTRLDLINNSKSTIKQAQYLTCEMANISLTSTRKLTGNNNVKVNSSLLSTRTSSESTKEDTEEAEDNKEDTEEDIIIEEVSPKRIKHYASFGRRKEKKPKRKIHKDEKETDISGLCYILWFIGYIGLCYIIYNILSI